MRRDIVRTAARFVLALPLIVACAGDITPPSAPATRSDSVTVASTPVSPTPDVFIRPFTDASPWNTPLVAYPGATYYPTTAFRSTSSQRWFPAFSPWLKANWVAIYKAQPSDPVVGIYFHYYAWTKVFNGEWKRSGNPPEVEAEIRRGMNQGWLGYQGNMYSTTDPAGFRMPEVFKRREDPYWSLTAHVPDAAVPPPDTDGMIAVFQPNGTVLEMLSGIRLSSGELVSFFASYTDPSGDGTGTADGRRASMVPSYAGVIRRGELTSGRIEHALCAAVGPEALARDIRWPATAMDRNPTDYSGPLPMGTLLALPPSTRLEDLDLKTREGRIVAAAALKYGMYVVDRSGSRAFVLCTERDAPDVPPYSWAMEQDLARIRDALQVVTLPR